jgi:hypothetical protein
MDVSFLIRQHRTIEHLLHELRSDGYRRDSLRLRLLGELSTHVAVELNVLYPALRNAVRVLDLNDEVKILQQAKELLFVLTKDAARGGEFQRHVEELEALFAKHVELQEKELFPICKATLDGSTLEEIMGDVAAVSFRLASQPRHRDEVAPPPRSARSVA